MGLQLGKGMRDVCANSGVFCVGMRHQGRLGSRSEKSQSALANEKVGTGGGEQSTGSDTYPLYLTLNQSLLLGRLDFP